MQATTNAVNFHKGEEVLKSVPVKESSNTVIDWDVPDEETMELCHKKAASLRKNHPKWNSEKIARKVAEHFKLKRRKPVSIS